ELEIAAGELVESGFVLKKDDLTERLTAGLQSDAHLRHCGVADVLTLFVNPAFAVRGTDPQTSFGDRGEDRVTVAVFEECGAFTGLLEHIDRIGIVICPRQRAGDHHHSQSQHCEFLYHGPFSFCSAGSGCRYVSYKFRSPNWLNRQAGL